MYINHHHRPERNTIMLKDDLTLRRLLRELDTPVDCQFMTPSPFVPGEATACGERAENVVVTRAGAWRALCDRHANMQPNMGMPGLSFSITYVFEECQHSVVTALEPTEDGDAWVCETCGITF